MCIIVAKKKNVPMPSEKILKNCFTRNPDGAGIMLAAKGQVWGFKGLMTFEAFEAKLKQLTKRFGSLNKLPVIMHFRIGTHGGNVPENTHPFPLSDSYDDLRALEWVSNQGMAHNGIIHSVSDHDDIFDEHVSDTMVFVKRIAAPVSKYNNITKRGDLLDMLGLVADSKLAFMDSKGNIATSGKFEKKDNILYSNSSYSGVSYITSNIKKFHNYYYDDFNDISSYTSSGYKNITIPAYDQKDLKRDAAIDYGFTYPLTTPFVTDEGKLYANDDLEDLAFDEYTKIIYKWDYHNFDWVPVLFNNEYEFFEVSEDAT